MKWSNILNMSTNVNSKYKIDICIDVNHDYFINPLYTDFCLKYQSIQSRIKSVLCSQCENLIIKLVQLVLN